MPKISAYTNGGISRSGDKFVIARAGVNYAVELFPAATTKTISGGVLTVDQTAHKVAPQSGTTDDIDTISGMQTGSILYLAAISPSTQTLTFKHGTGNLSCFGGSDISLTQGFIICFYDGTTVFVAGGGGGAPTTSVKGRVEMTAISPPLTLGAPINAIDGASSPAEGIPIYEFANGSVTYRDYYCRLYDYQGGGLTFKFEVLRTSAAAAATYIFEAAIRRINTGTEDVTAAHTYDYNSTTITIPSGPPAAGIPIAGTITFTDGADMDSLADGEAFFFRFRRNGGTATDTARVIATITGKET